ncbi:putative lipoprotein [Afipia sp. 1NLS2]|nr:putative lipoprotein [Afipia sp. 1NLS2]
MLIALIVAFAVAVPAGARVMPLVGSGMPTSMGMMEKVADQPCQNCPEHQSGSTAPDKMPGCPALACIAAPAVVPSPARLPGRISYRTEYTWPVTALLAGADPAPDPFPPRPIVLL